MDGEKRTEGRQERRALVCAVAFPLLAGVGVWLLTTVLWANSLWSNLKMNEIVAQLTDSIGGAGGGLMESYYISCVAPGLTALVCGGMLLLALRDIKLRPWNLLARIGASVGAALILGTAAWAFALYDVGGYLAGATVSSDYIMENYADPNQVELTFPARKRNLVVIWLESMETTYADTANGGAFAATPVKELIALSAENENFSGTRGGVNGGYAAYGCTWTSGAIFAQTSGLPLKNSITGENVDMGVQDYLNNNLGATTLGDILKAQGYRQRLRIGSPASFGGRQTYFVQHGDYEIRDYNYSLAAGEIPPDYYTNWGYEDETLFALAKADLLELAAGDRPFNLSILTTDTHFPDGFPCRLCGSEFGEDQYSNAIACSSRQVAEFVAWIQAQPFYENTTIVVSGDHLTMDVDYCDNVPEDYPRRVLTTIINPAAQVADPTAWREYATVDIFPTTLAALGVDIRGDRLGLGANLFSQEETLVERDGLERLNREFQLRSEFLESLSKGLYVSYSVDLYQIDGELQPVAGYKTNNTNFVKLEDMAILLKGTEKQFNIRNGLFGRVDLLTGEPYGKGLEALSQRSSGANSALFGERTFYLDGEPLTVVVCESGGGYYVKLRDLGIALDFYVGYEPGAHRGTIIIDTARGYGT